MVRVTHVNHDNQPQKGFCHYALGKNWSVHDIGSPQVSKKQWSFSIEKPPIRGCIIYGHLKALSGGFRGRSILWDKWDPFSWRIRVNFPPIWIVTVIPTSLWQLDTFDYGRLDVDWRQRTILGGKNSAGCYPTPKLKKKKWLLLWMTTWQSITPTDNSTKILTCADDQQISSKWLSKMTFPNLSSFPMRFLWLSVHAMFHPKAAPQVPRHAAWHAIAQATVWAWAGAERNQKFHGIFTLFCTFKQFVHWLLIKLYSI